MGEAAKGSGGGLFTEELDADTERSTGLFCCRDEMGFETRLSRSNERSRMEDKRVNGRGRGKNRQLEGLCNGGGTGSREVREST